MIRGFTVVALLSVVLAPAVYAEPDAPPNAQQPGIRASLTHVRFDAEHHSTSQVSSPAPSASPADKVNAAIAFGLLGIFAGGYLGMPFDRHCGCEDKHALIGAQIGAVAGAVIGWHLAR